MWTRRRNPPVPFALIRAKVPKYLRRLQARDCKACKTSLTRGSLPASSGLPLGHVVLPHEIAIGRNLEGHFFSFGFHHDFVVPPTVTVIFPRQFNDLTSRGLLVNRFLHRGWQILQVHWLTCVKALHMFARQERRA